jgi:DNA-binding response OmpR family regulator
VSAPLKKAHDSATPHPGTAIVRANGRRRKLTSAGLAELIRTIRGSGYQIDRVDPTASKEDFKG